MRGYSATVNKVDAFISADKLGARPDKVVPDRFEGIPGGVTLFGHHARVDLTYSSRYPYDVLQFLADRLYDYFIRNKYQAGGFIRDVGDWVFVGERRVRGRKYFVFKNVAYGVELRARPSWVDDAPIVIHFDDMSTVTVKLIYANTSDARVVYSNSPKLSVQVDLYGRLDFAPLLDLISKLPNRELDFLEGLVKVRFVKFEVYVRYPRRQLRKVEKALLAIRDRIGIGYEVRDKLQFGGQYWVVVDAVYQGVRFKLKSYLTHKHPDRDPKLELVLPLKVEFRDIADMKRALETVRDLVEFGKRFLASFVVAAGLEVAPSSVDSSFKAFGVTPVEEYVAFILGAGLSYELERQFLDDGRLDEVDRIIISELTKRNLTSKDLPRLATLAGKAKRTIQYHMKKLSELGYVDYDEMGGNNQWVYWLVVDKLVGKEQGRDSWRDYIDGAFKEVAVQHILSATDVSITRRSLDNFVLTLWLIYKGANTISALRALLPEFGVSAGKRTVQKWLSQLVEWGLVEPVGKGRRRRYTLKFKP